MYSAGTAELPYTHSTDQRVYTSAPQIEAGVARPQNTVAKQWPEPASGEADSPSYHIGDDSAARQPGRNGIGVTTEMELRLGAADE